jgi:hypothetical protein
LSISSLSNARVAFGLVADVIAGNNFPATSPCEGKL